jgi:hypothetical protein
MSDGGGDDQGHRNCCSCAHIHRLCPAMARAEESQGSAGNMLPLCKSWLRLTSQHLDAVKQELAAGNARPGGIFMHSTMAGSAPAW